MVSPFGARTHQSARRIVSSAASDRAVAWATLVGVVFALVLVVGIAEAGAAQGEAQKCGDVVVQFKPEGSGGAHAIRATGIGCGPARNVARSCVKGTVASGWTALSWDGRVYLSKVGKKIRYTGVGGGGCGLPQKSCHDFSYRGVGFFGVEVVGTACGEGAKSRWAGPGTTGAATARSGTPAGCGNTAARPSPAPRP